MSETDMGDQKNYRKSRDKQRDEEILTVTTIKSANKMNIPTKNWLKIMSPLSRT